MSNSQIFRYLKQYLARSVLEDQTHVQYSFSQEKTHSEPICCYVMYIKLTVYCKMMMCVLTLEHYP